MLSPRQDTTEAVTFSELEIIGLSTGASSAACGSDDDVASGVVPTARLKSKYTDALSKVISSPFTEHLR